MKKRVLFLMSDTGGGHRAAAEAIRDGLFARYGADNIDAELLDVFKMSRFPMNYFPEFYPWLINRSKGSWGLGYKISNTRRRVAVISRTMYAANARHFKKIARDNPVDVVVCVHSLVARPSLKAWKSLPERPPFITVVTDLVSTHNFWYDKNAEHTMVPTQAAFDRGLKYGMPAHKMSITGLPVNPAFIEKLEGKEQAREKLGWEPGKVTILMVAGGDGMGPLWETARAINALNRDIQLVVIAGRNATLKEKCDAASWNQPTHIYPFVTNMPQLMDASDIIVTKAGPATITEAAIAGLPMILMDAIPGQEDGNVDYVIENDAGAWAPEPQKVATTIGDWLAGSDVLRRKAQNVERIARPDAVWDICDIVMKWSNYGPIKNPEQLWARTRKHLVSMRR
ncbi:MAG: MGDG synthase family glycosyltransferase [Anaerolineae bacterium]